MEMSIMRKLFTPPAEGAEEESFDLEAWKRDRKKLLLWSITALTVILGGLYWAFSAIKSISL
jgi:hypothetical protein